MTTTWFKPLQKSLLLTAFCLATAAGAQTPPPPPAPAPAGAAPSAQMPQGPAKVKPPKPHHQADKKRPPHEREHGAMRPERNDRMPGNGPRDASRDGMSQYERNALLRCDVFKNDDDRRACFERVRAPADGSVSGGGVIREYTQEIRTN